MKSQTYPEIVDPKGEIAKHVYDFQLDPLGQTDNMAALIETLNEVQVGYLLELAYHGYHAVESSENARVGAFGKRNKKVNNRRNRRFVRHVKQGTRADDKLFLIEGDSWFNFPVRGKADLSKIMNRQMKNIWIYSNSYGGDWMAKKILDQEYLKNLKALQPEFLILSGGGNDMVKENLIRFIDKDSNNVFIKSDIIGNDKGNKQTSLDVLDTTYLKIAKRYFQTTIGSNENGFINDKIDPEILEGMKYLNERFFVHVALLEMEYRLVLKQVKELDPKNRMVVITQGYDNPIPSGKKPFLVAHPFQGALNWALKSGEWLYTPMKMKGIDEPDLQRKIAKAMIFFFNKTLIILANEKNSESLKNTSGFEFKYPQLIHVDNRGLIEALTVKKYCTKANKHQRRYWFDELHPRKKVYKKIVDVFNEIKADHEGSKSKRVIMTKEKV